MAEELAALGDKQDIKKTDEKKEYHDYLWQEPGFHRTLGSVWFQYLPYVYIAFTSIFYLIVVLPVFLPPETMGADTIFKSLLGFISALAQVGVGDAIQRFVSEKRISQPKYTIYYIRFFIWFRLFSGMILITIVSIWVFTFLRYFVPLNYSMWFFLWYITLEWPGFWQAYMSTMQGYQQFNKVNYINIATMIVSFLTGYSMVQLFKFIFSHFPQFGEGFGNLFGFVVSLYLNNVFMFLASAYAFKSILKNIDPEWSIGKTLTPEFPREIFIECVKFGAQSMSATFLDTGFRMIITYIAILWLPNYGTIFGLFTSLTSVVALISVEIPITPIVSEAYNNKKIDLTEYYLGHGLKYCGMFASIFGSVILALGPIFIYLAGPYALAAEYLPYIAAGRMIWAFGKMLDDSSNGCNKPFFRVYYYLIENATRLTLMAVFILGLNLGWIGFLLAEICGYIAKVIFGWLIFRTKIMNPYISSMQSIILPAITGFIHYWVIRAIISFLLLPVSMIFGTLVTIGFFIILFYLITPIYVWWPIYTLLGGWDPVGLDIMEEATEISDLSKPIARQFNKITQKLARKSPFYNHFRIHFRSAQYELDELRVMMGREPKHSLHIFDYLPKLAILDNKDIAYTAYLISKENKTYDQLVWMFAEECLRIQNAILFISSYGTHPAKLQIRPELLNPYPSHEKIQKRAEFIYQNNHPTERDLHWYIAERRLLYEYILKQKEQGKQEIQLEIQKK